MLFMAASISELIMQNNPRTWLATAIHSHVPLSANEIDNSKKKAYRQK